MRRECDQKLEQAHREHSDKLSTLTRDYQIKFDSQKRESDLRIE